MEAKVKKLALWHTKTFRPLLDHDDLQPLMEVLGFEALPLKSPSGKNGWKEYIFRALRQKQEDGDERRFRGERLRGERGQCQGEEDNMKLPLEHPVRPRLPFPRIDGLHLLTYDAFIDAVAFYIGADKVSDHFHVRSMPVHRVHDRIFDKTFRRMCEDRRVGEEERMLVYRDGTIDQASLYPPFVPAAHSAAVKTAPKTSTCMVSLKEILPPPNHIAV